MRQDPSSPRGTLLLTLLGGAALGAIVMALTTPKTGRQVRQTLRGTLDRLRGLGMEEDDALEVEASEAMFI